jgi:hypothetical protein
MARAICDICGFEYKREELRERWDKFMVCAEDFETRHPQDFVRAVPDQLPLPWTRPEPTDDTSLEVELNPDTQTDIPDGNFTENNSTL